jgi:hypothetical protein
MSPTKKDRAGSFLLSATVDFPDDVRKGVYSHEGLDDMMAHLKRLGVRRVNWIYYGDLDQDSYWAGGAFYRNRYGPETLDRIGEPLAAAVQAAHKNDLEIHGVVKPYDIGGSGSFPEGSAESAKSITRRIGGTVQFLVPFLERYPHTLIQRRPYKAPPGLSTLPIKKIRLLKRDASPTRIRKENLQIWTSDSNYRYERKRVDFTLKEAMEPAPKEVRDSYDALVTSKGAPVRTLTLEGLDLTDRYVVITTDFTDVTGDFTNTALGMLEAYGLGPEPIPVVVASRSAMWDAPRDFRSHGLEFDSGFGHYLGDLDANNTTEKENIRWRSASDDGVIAFSRGKNETLASAPCEAYPEVIKLWSGWIDKTLQTGVDGLSVRLNSHGGCNDEPNEYGFNEPLLEEYRQRYGVDALEDDAVLDRLPRLRGEHVTAFLRDTAAKVRRAGKKMQIHMHHDAFRPNPSPRERYWSLTNINYDWKAWLGEGLADGSIMRPSRFEGVPNPAPGQAKRAGISHTLSDAVVKDMLASTGKAGVPVYFNGFIHLMTAEQYVSEMETTFRDERFAGFDLYEVAAILGPNSNGTRVEELDGGFDKIMAKSQELGIA